MFISTLKELWEYVRARKKYWLLPIIVSLLLLGIFVVVTEGTAVAPFIYAIF